MRPTFVLTLALIVTALGCKKPEDAPAAPSGSPAAKADAPGSPDASGLKAKVVGDWSVASKQGNTTIDATVAMMDDGTFTYDGTISGETPGEDGTVNVTLAYTIHGKWTIEGDSIATTPGDVTTKVEHIEITAKNPANQAALDAQKEDLAKKAEEQSKAGMMNPTKSKIVEATADKLTLASSDGARIEYLRKG